MMQCLGHRHDKQEAGLSGLLLCFYVCGVCDRCSLPSSFLRCVRADVQPVSTDALRVCTDWLVEWRKYMCWVVCISDDWFKCVFWHLESGNM